MSRGSFKRQLMMTLTLGLLSLALTSAVVTSWVLQSQLRVLAINYGANLTAYLGQNQAFALMVTDRQTVVEQAVASIRAFPGVDYVALLKSDYTILSVGGESPNWSIADSVGDWHQQPSLVKEDSTRWYFWAPVKTLSAIEQFDEIPLNKPDRIIGYVVIAWQKTLLSNVENVVYIICGGVSLLSVFLLWGLLRWRVRQMTRPLSDLVAVMNKARIESEGERVTAVSTGPQEVQAITLAFNELYTQLERQKHALESEVAIRTKDLQQARDDALTAVRHKSEFLATVTHEMRTPLHNVNYHTELARDELRFANQVDLVRVDHYLQVIQTKGGELLRLINRFLDFARSEAGKDDVRLTTVNLEDMVAQLKDTIQPLADRNGNRLSTECEGTPALLIDSDKLEQILSNLLTNACKFTHNGTILLKMSCTRNKLVINVIDTGIGISPEQLPNIFQPFTQVDMSDSRRYGGTGLGLAIAQSYCRLLNGIIAVQSEIDKGTQFTVEISLPIQHSAGGNPMLAKNQWLPPLSNDVDQNLTRN